MNLFFLPFLRFSTGAVYLYEFDGKHFVIQIHKDLIAKYLELIKQYVIVPATITIIFLIGLH
jgi:hypothetical protein